MAIVAINSKHKPLYASSNRYVYEKGGRGSGKSTAVTDYCLRLSYDTDRVILFLRYTMVASSVSIIPEFEKAMQLMEVSHDFETKGSQIINKISGSKVIFKGVKTSSLNQTANLKSIQGLTDVIYDEFEEHPDQESFDKLDESIRKVGVRNKIVLVSNALHAKSWQSLQFFHKSGLYYTMTDRIYTNFEDNYENLSESWHIKRKIVKEKNIKKYNRDYLGLDYEDEDGALWSSELIKRVSGHPDLVRIVVAIDPAVTSEEHSDETGIIAGGIDSDGNGYILRDLSGIMTPSAWCNKAINVYHELEADRIVAEVNQGGDLVKTIIKSIDHHVAYSDVRATRGKMLRAEPVVSLYEEGKVFHVGDFPELEHQMTTWNPTKGNSPDRVDALVWLLTELVVTNKMAGAWTL